METKKHIKPEEINYLSFKGGGAKGAAYLAPLITMLHPSFNIFKKEDNPRSYMVLNRDKIKGISGASVGAITATLLASNVPLENIAKLILNLDPPKYGIKELYNEKNVIAAFKEDHLDKRIKNLFVPDITDTKYFGFSFSKKEPLNVLIYRASKEIFKRLFPQILPFDLYYNLETKIDNIYYDKGLTPGYLVRKYIAYAIQDGLSAQYCKTAPFLTSQELLNINFQQHKEKTGIELVLTSVNLSLRQMFYLSYKTTPNLRVADAVRMSMSLPPLFKPVHISTKQVEKGFNDLEKRILPGFWIDGGVMNNNPIHAFDVNKNGEMYKIYKEDIINPNLLGLCLGKEKTTFHHGYNINRYEAINDVIDYFSELKDVLISNSSSLQINSEYEKDRIIELTTTINKDEKLEVTDFEPKPSVLIKVLKEGVKDTMSYFGIPDNESPVINKEIQSNFSKELIYGLKLFSNA